MTNWGSLMKAIQTIRTYINSLPRGKPFMASSLRNRASSENIRQILSRLVKKGELCRVTRGVFVKPKEVPYLGKVLPAPEEIIKMISKKSGEMITVHGAEAARRLQLSTQTPVKPIFYTTGYSRHIKIENTQVILKHRSHRKLVKPGTLVGLVISALWYMGKKHVNTIVIKKIKNQISPEQFTEVLKNVNRMPAWMAQNFSAYQKDQKHVR